MLDGEQGGFYEETETHDPSLTVSYLRKTRVEAKSHSNSSHGVLPLWSEAVQTNTYENETPLVELLSHKIWGLHGNVNSSTSIELMWM